MCNLVKNCEDELVIAIDSPWGEGKSTFVKMWRGLLSDNKVESIYFDAFESDYQKDPFMAVAGEMYALLQEKHADEVSEFKEKSIATIKTLGRAGLRVGVKLATAGMLDETIFEDTKTVKDASKEASDLVDLYVSNKLDSIIEDKENITGFRNYLKTLPKILSEGNRVVFIIDELDRCRPTFALELLENIKHLFSVQGIVFVLVINRTQLEESIRCEYGTGVEAHKYLQKFINMWTSLPKNKDQRTNDVNMYVSNCMSRMDFEIKTQTDKDLKEIFQEYALHYNLSLRDIERSLTNFSLVYNQAKDLSIYDFLYLFPYLAIIKVIHPDTYCDLRSGKITYTEIVSKTMLTELSTDWWDDRPESHPLRWYLKYHLSTKAEAEELVKATHDYSGSHYRQGKAIVFLCELLDTFKVN